MTAALTRHRRPSRRRRRVGLPRCKFCGQPVLWCSTASGKSMPVDPEPAPRTGTVLLTSQPDAPRARPLAITFREYERRQLPPGSIHTSHMKTCQADPGLDGN